MINELKNLENAIISFFDHYNFFFFFKNSNSICGNSNQHVGSNIINNFTVKTTPLAPFEFEEKRVWYAIEIKQKRQQVSVKCVKPNTVLIKALPNITSTYIRIRMSWVLLSSSNRSLRPLHRASCGHHVSLSPAVVTSSSSTQVYSRMDTFCKLISYYKDLTFCKWVGAWVMWLFTHSLWKPDWIYTEFSYSTCSKEALSVFLLLLYRNSLSLCLYLAN